MIKDLFFVLFAFFTGRVPSFSFVFGLAAGHGENAVADGFAIGDKEARDQLRQEWVNAACEVKAKGGVEVSGTASNADVGYFGPLLGEAAVRYSGDFIPDFSGGRGIFKMLRWIKSTRSIIEKVRFNTGQEAVIGHFALVKVEFFQGEIAQKFRSKDFVKKDDLA